MEKYVIPNLRNACLVLKHLASSQQPRSIKEISALLHLPRTTTMRILATLTLQGFTHKNHERFSLGPALISIGSAAKTGLDIGNLSKPLLRRVTLRTGETCHLAVPSGNRSMIVEVSLSPHPLSSSRGPGALVELHCSGTGKCFLAFRHWPQLDSIITERELVPHTKDTIVKMDRLASEIATVRRQKYAMDEQEFFEGVRCIAAPVFNAENECVAAFGVTASTTRFALERVDEFAAILKEAANELSTLLGWTGSHDTNSNNQLADSVAT